MTERTWESELTDFLAGLSAAQDQTLSLLARKRDLLVAADATGLAALAEEENQAIARLHGCLDQRERLLQRAGDEGLPSDSLRSLAAAIPQNRPGAASDQVRQAMLRSRLLQHQGLVNWVLVHRTLIHLSQLLEIIATGGRMKPTYREEETLAATGSLVDQEV